MIELNEEQHSKLHEWIDREFLIRGGSLLETIMAAVSHMGNIGNDHRLISLAGSVEDYYSVCCNPRLLDFIDRQEAIDNLLEDLEAEEDSDEPDEDIIDDLTEQINDLRNDDSWRDSHEPGEYYNVFIVTDHFASYSYWDTIQARYPGSVIPIVNIAGINFWINYDSSLEHCDWLRLAVRECVRP